MESARKPAPSVSTDAVPTLERLLEVETSNTLENPAWDEFLGSHPEGQFQQSTAWAVIKSAEGWAPVRCIVRGPEGIRAGFQILLRRRSGRTEALLNKGPVAPNATPEMRRWLLSLVQDTARAQRITLLIAQAPDLDPAMERAMDEAGLMPDAIGGILTASLWTNLRRTDPPWRQRLRKTTQQEARQALRRGMTIREGGSADVPAFFELMQATCRRQQTLPNPATPEAMQTLFDQMHRSGLARLSFAEFEGKPCAASFCIRMGQRVTLWKKGWNDLHREKHPSTLATMESMEWAEAQGAEWYDFVGAGRDFCRRLLSGESLDKDQQSTRYFNLLGFGAEPKLLPLPRVWCPNTLVRAVYRTALPVMKKLGRIQV